MPQNGLRARARVVLLCDCIGEGLVAVDAARILVCVPNWVGDVVMATPALRAIRRRFKQARITHLMRPYVAEVLAGTSFSDEAVFWPDGRAGGQASGDKTTGSQLSGSQASGGLLGLARRLRACRFDLAVLLTNSFRSALIARLAGAGRRAGYARDGRGWLLTDRLQPPRDGRRFVPAPALDYYNELACCIGCPEPGDRLELAALPADEQAVDRRLGPCDEDRPLVVLNPGAHYGSAKCWPAEYYAELADALVDRCGARVVASLAPGERDIAERLRSAARRPMGVFVDPPLGLGPLKALIRRCHLLVTNDTGPRHFAAAFDVPVVTIFGSSDPAWTDTRFAKERAVMLGRVKPGLLDCQPCMERTCPLGHHRCMRELTPTMVLEAAEGLLGQYRGARAAVGPTCS